MVICVTGKIGSGKSTVARTISDLLGFEVVDVDEVGHEVLEDGEVIQELVERFGKFILNGSGRIDRKVLGEIVFGNEENLKDLERIVHPRMREIVEKRLEDLENAVLDCALLERMKLVDLCDLVITVVSSFETSRNRKRFISEERFRRIWNSQVDVRPIGIVLENEGNLEDLRRAVTDVLKREGLLRDDRFPAL